MAETKLHSPWSLLAHAVIQGGCAALIAGLLGYPVLAVGLIVGITHFWIDWGKILGKWGLAGDQFLHLFIMGLLGCWFVGFEHAVITILTFFCLWAFIYFNETQIKWGWS